MLHTLKDGDYRLLYKTQNIERSDIVVFSLTTSKYIKRGVGMPGDTISVDSKGILTRNNQLIAEDYTNKERSITPFINNKPFIKNYIVPYKGFTTSIDSLFLEKYKPIIKALEGETIRYIDGKYLLKNKVLTSYTFKEDCFYFLGDNRAASKDSRYFGAIPRSFISGKLVFD